MSTISFPRRASLPSRRAIRINKLAIHSEWDWSNPACDAISHPPRPHAFVRVQRSISIESSGWTVFGMNLPSAKAP
jgi:hypothetical protein